MHFHIFYDQLKPDAGYQLLTEPVDLTERVTPADVLHLWNTTHTYGRYEIYVVEVPTWMTAIEFPAWALDHRNMSWWGVPSTWDKQTWHQLRKLIHTRHQHFATCHIRPRLDDAPTPGIKTSAFLRTSIYLRKAKLSGPRRVAARAALAYWISSGADFSRKDFLPDLSDSQLFGMANDGWPHFRDTDAWRLINTPLPRRSDHVHQEYVEDFDQVRPAARMRKLAREAEAQRISLAPKPIVTTDDLAALGDVF